MLKPENRLRRSEDFRSTIRRGMRVGRPLVVVHLVATGAQGVPSDAVATDEKRGPTRVGFVVGRTVGGAVVRNAVRRRLRHLVGDRLPLLPPGAQLVIRAQPEAAQAPGAVLARDLDEALSRVVERLEAKR